MVGGIGRSEKDKLTDVVVFQIEFGKSEILLSICQMNLSAFDGHHQRAENLFCSKGAYKDIRKVENENAEAREGKLGEERRRGAEKEIGRGGEEEGNDEETSSMGEEAQKEVGKKEGMYWRETYQWNCFEGRERGWPC